MDTTSAVGGGNEAENIGCSQDQSESGRSLCRSTSPGDTGRRTVSWEQSWHRVGQTARGGLFAESRIRGQAVQRVRQAGSLDRACIVQPKFLFFKLPPCFSPMSVVSEVFCCIQILARLLSGYCVKFKG